MNLFKIIAIIGLLFIIAGVLFINPKYKKRQYILFILGGLFLEGYSIYINDLIFIILQAVFTLSSIYGLFKLRGDRKWNIHNFAKYMKN